jgi:polyisoprenyl-phosphate glycosyltransferase
VANPKKIVIATPVFNDWSSVSILVKEIDHLLSDREHRVHVLILDDGSTQNCDALRASLVALKAIQQLDVIHIARNVGHQKAIALGLAYIHDHLPCDQVIVMDCDGEDRPEDILSLMHEHEQESDCVIFAKRSRRSEGVVFRIFYAVYRIIFRFFTGQPISFGNFSLIPSASLPRLVHLPEIWNHVAAGIMRSNLPWKCVPTIRGKRYSGNSRMDLVSLVIHGLSAISVYLEVLTVRLILLTFLLITATVAAFGVLLHIKYNTALAIPGWATSVAIGLAVIMFQAILFLTLLSFVILNQRTTKLFIPAKDYRDYFVQIERLL